MFHGTKWDLLLGILSNKSKVVDFDRYEEYVYIFTSSIHINTFFNVVSISDVQQRMLEASFEGCILNIMTRMMWLEAATNTYNAILLSIWFHDDHINNQIHICDDVFTSGQCWFVCPSVKLWSDV